MYTPVFLLSFFCLITLSSGQRKAAVRENVLQAEFSWNFYKSSFDPTQNMVQSPYAVRLILAFLTNLLHPKTPVPAWIKSTNLSNTNRLNRYYKLRLERFKAMRDMEMNNEAIATGNGTLSAHFDNIAENYNISHSNQPLTQATSTTTMQWIKNFFSNAYNYVKSLIVKSKNSPADSELIMLSSVNFSGIWKLEFEKDFSKICYFYSKPETKQLIRYMYLDQILRYNRFFDLNLDMLELSFQKGSPFSCVLLIPLNGNLEQIIPKLSQQTFESSYKALKLGKVQVELPSFTMIKEFSTKMTLEQMGFSKLFDESKFRIFDDKETPVADIIQRSKITVTRNGTRSGKKIVGKDGAFPFVAQTPFIFVIIAKATLVPVLMGHYAYPEMKLSPAEENNYIDEMCQLPPDGFE